MLRHSRHPAHHESVMDSVPEYRPEGDWFPANGPLNPLPLHLPILEVKEREQPEAPPPHGHHPRTRYQSGRHI